VKEIFQLAQLVARLKATVALFTAIAHGNAERFWRLPPSQSKW
jgi:hypothetical protein